MKKFILFLFFVLAGVCFPRICFAQYSFVKYVPKYVHVEPELDYVEHMVVEVSGEWVVRIVYNGKSQSGILSKFAQSLQRWEQEAWKIESATCKITPWYEGVVVYVLTRPVYKKGKVPDKK